MTNDELNAEYSAFIIRISSFPRQRAAFLDFISVLLLGLQISS